MLHHRNLHSFPTRRSSDLLNQRLMQDTKVSLNEAERRAQYAKIEKKQLAIENARRQQKGEEQLKTLINEDEDDHIAALDRKSTRLNSSHVRISYAVFCLKK